MHYKFFLLPLLLGAPALAAAQAPDTATTYRHALGLTASPVLEGFFRNNRSLPLGLLYKRQLTPTRALRLGAVADYRYQKRYDPVPLSNRDFRQTDTRLEAYAGLEWQRPLSRRWVAYAGVDVGAAYSNEFSQEYSESSALYNGINTTFSLDEDLTMRTYTGFVRPLAGVRYHLRPFLYVSAEAALPIQCSYYKLRSSTTRWFKDSGQMIGTDIGGFQEHRLNLDFRPVSQLSVHYLFGQR